MNLPIAEVFEKNVETELSSEYSHGKQKLFKYFAGFTQFLSWPIIYIFFNAFYSIKITGSENIKKEDSPFILISNHIRFYDSFVFRLVLGAIPKNLPLRFMAVNSFRTWYLNFLSTIFVTDIVYALFGVFVVVRGKGIDRNLADAVNIINNGGNVVVYPEGSIVSDGSIADFKLGAAVLAKKTLAKVVPVSMKIVPGKYRDKFIINVGENVIYNSELPAEDISKTFRDTIVKLQKS